MKLLEDSGSSLWTYKVILKANSSFVCFEEVREVGGWRSKPERKWCEFFSDALIHINYAKSIKWNGVNLTFRVSFFGQFYILLCLYYGILFTQ